jgi:hypothetical protein
MESDSKNLIEEKEKPYVLIYIFVIILISIVLIALRIIFYIFHDELSGIFFLELLIKNRDLNFQTNYNLMYNGIFHYYEDNPLIDQKALYLYFWYFIFYPFHVIPIGISIYIWDLLRLVTTIFIVINIKKIIESKRDLLFFLLFSGIGYFADMYLNNTNWLIQLFLFESYIQIEKNRKLMSGIFFAFCTFKIILILVPFILILVKRIKVKDLFFYFLPFLIICIPYIIFPEYLMMMVSNWLKSVEPTSGFSVVSIFLIFWRVIQPAQLLFLSVIIVFILLNIENEEIKYRIGSLIYIFVSILWVIIWLAFLVLALFI